MSTVIKKSTIMQYSALKAKKVRKVPSRSCLKCQTKTSSSSKLSSLSISVSVSP